MFRRRGLFRALLVVFIGLSLLSMIGSVSFRAGWSQGYVAGQTAESSSDDTAADEVAPPVSQGHHFYGRGWGGFFSPFFWIVGAFFKFWLFLFVIGAFFKLFRFGMGKRYGGKHWSKQWHHGYIPPWYDDSGDEPVMKA